METRNTPVLREIIEALSAELNDAPQALDQLESHFQGQPLVDAGSVTIVASRADQLRLQVTSAECSQVLDYMAEQKIVAISIDHVETVINELFEDRFIEP